MKWRKLASWLLTAGLLLALWQYQAIVDWWTLRSYDPPAEIVNLVKTANLSDEGERTFYLSTPEINNKQEFTQNCPVLERPDSLVLGCYHANNSFVLKVSDSRLKGVMTVTAAHEMLHAAYERLSESEREQVDQMLTKFYPTINDPDFKALIKDYQRTEPGQLNNELHSLIPTEIEKIPAELEDYYKQYFINRNGVISQFKQYQSVFEAIRERQEGLEERANSLKSQIEDMERQINDAASRANRLSAQIQQLRAQGKVEESNALVPEQNQAASEANALASQGQAAIDEYNRIVLEINKLALVTQDLYDRLDASKFEEVNTR